MKLFVIAVLVLYTSVSGIARGAEPRPDKSIAGVCDGSDEKNWPAYGRTHAAQHYSPLDGINAANVTRLGLAWAMDLEPLKNSATQPIAVDGILYFATGLSVIHAVDASSGKLLW